MIIFLMLLSILIMVTAKIKILTKMEVDEFAEYMVAYFCHEIAR